MNKKGLAVSVIVVMIIIVIGFAILLFFYSQIAWTGNIDRSVCHQSVIYRAILPEFANAKDFVPLKCRTEKICITSSFLGKCKEFEGAKRVTRVKVNDIQDVEQIISQEILSCWKTMGEGQLSLFSNGILLDNFGLGEIKSSCVICSRIAFDEDNLKKANIDKNKVDVFKYMISHKVPNEEISYYEKILGNKGSLSINDANRNENNLNKGFENYKAMNNEELFVPSISSSDELSILFMQVTSTKWQDIVVGDLALLGIGSLGYNYAGSYIPKTISGSKIFSGATSLAIRVAVVAAIAGVAIQANSYWENKGITAGYCGDVKVGEDAQKGCSVVRTMNYNVNDISQFCGKIESIS